MAEPEKPIFRSQALARYLDNYQEPVFPKLIGPNLIPKLWVLVLALMGGLLVLVWFPISQTRETHGVFINADGADHHWTIAITTSNSWQLSQNSTVALVSLDGRLGKVTIARVSAPASNQSALMQISPALPTASLPTSWPIQIAAITAPRNMGLPLPGQKLTIKVTGPPRRLLGWVPGI